MFMLPPSTRYCPHCNQSTAQTELICARCGKSTSLPEASLPGSRRNFDSVMLQVEPKGLLIDAFATALTTLGLLLIGYSAIRIATRPLVFLAPVQTVYNAELDDVEALPITSISPIPGQNIVSIAEPVSNSRTLPLDSSKPDLNIPDFAFVNTPESKSNGLVFSFWPTSMPTSMPWPPHHRRYVTLPDR